MLIIVIVLILILIKFGGGAAPDEQKFVKFLFANPNFKHQTFKSKYGLIPEQMNSIKYFWALERIVKISTINNDDYFPSPLGKGTNILHLSAKYRVPPVHLLKLYMRKKYPNFNVKNPPADLSARDKSQLKLAFAHDDYTYPNGDDQQERALQFEADIEAILKKRNLKFKTQEDLIKAGARTTPDFVLPKLWIDAKNFYAPDLPFIRQKIMQQAKKYVRDYGAGLMVFRWGCNAAYRLADVKFISWEQFSTRTDSLEF